MALNVPGVVVMVFFYLMVLGTGIWASFKSKRESKKSSADQVEMTLLGNRGIHLVVGMFTMTGAVMSVILDISYTVSIWISAAVAITYTLLGGLYSVAYTDVIQLILMFFSAWLCVPFVLMSPAASSVSNTTLDLNSTGYPPWVGTWEEDSLLMKGDTFLFLAFGFLASQPVHQRILSASSSLTAKLSCYAAAVALVVFAIPPAIIGGVAVIADWNKTSYGSPSPFERGDGVIIFPIALNYLTPPYIGIIGISAVAAAVMSSTDSALLSAASTFSNNIYKNILRPQASQREMQWVIRAVVLVMGVAGTSLTFTKKGTLVMWYIGASMTYNFLLPQLICVLFLDKANGYGSLTGFVVSLVLRLLCGWPSLGIPAVLHLPGGSFEDGVHVQRFPVNTLCVLCSLACILTFSYLTALLFDQGIIPEAWDVLNFLKLPRKLPSLGASNEDKKRRLEEKDPQRDPSEPMMNTTC
ncbi:high-affinity choline transporter 1 isoform X2 [Gadus morhua]|uniref:high-affinity choline transporter 1 isoform X2 n=1 Tax=Gadus morhua TaxID=8049 RepID=UPI0011B6EE83|nr:high-affinity choline transporter 1-like isoform X2 [Gadus morhua]